MAGQAAAASVLQLSTFTTVQSIPRKEKYSDFPVTVHVAAPAMEVHQQCPVDIVAVVDISGSMSGRVTTDAGTVKRMDVVKDAMRNVIQKLGANNRLAIVPFNDSVQPGTPLTAMDNDGKSSATKKVDWMWAHGGTNFSAALDSATEILDKRPAGDKDRLAFIVFLSDGEDESFRKNGSLEKISKKYPIHTFGISAEHEAQTLEAMAQVTSGSYTPIVHDLEKITEKLAQLTDKLISVVAVDMRVDLTSAHTGVSLSRVESSGDKFKSNISDDKQSGVIDVPSMSSSEEREFIVYLDVPEGDADADAMKVLSVGGAYTQSWDTKKVDLASSVVSVARPAPPLPPGQGDGDCCKELEWIEKRVQYWCKVKLDLTAMYEAKGSAAAGNDADDCQCQCQVAAALWEASLQSIDRAMHHDIYTAAVYAMQLRKCRTSTGATENVSPSA